MLKGAASAEGISVPKDAMVAEKFISQLGGAFLEGKAVMVFFI